MADRKRKQSSLTHLDSAGRPRMVDVGGKEPSERRAVAKGRLELSSPGMAALGRSEGAGKGDPLGVAQVAAVQAAKRTGDWIPMAHPLPLTGVEVDWRLRKRARILEVQVEVRTISRTGVEMEALTAVSAALLTVYDMLKAVDKGMRIGPLWLSLKEGGRSGKLSFEDPPLT